MKKARMLEHLRQAVANDGQSFATIILAVFELESKRCYYDNACPFMLPARSRKGRFFILSNNTLLELLNNLPEGIDIQSVDALGQELERKRRRDYYKKNPERMLQQRIRTSINFLSRNGYTVTRKEGGQS